MPSFWLNDEWDWMLLTKNLSNITTEIYTGEFQDFLTRLIYGCLSMHGKDPENFITENIKNPATMRRYNWYQCLHKLEECGGGNCFNEIQDKYLC